MALEDIFRALQEQAYQDVAAVLEEAQAHAAVITEEAQREAKSAAERRVAEAERMAVAKSGQELNHVRLEARKRVAAVKEKAVREAFDDAMKALGQVRSRADYAQIFRALADEALDGVTATDIEVLVDPADVDLAREVIATKGVSAEVKPDLCCAGGLVVATQGGTIQRRNTLEDCPLSMKS